MNEKMYKKINQFLMILIIDIVIIAILETIMLFTNISFFSIVLNIFNLSTLFFIYAHMFGLKAEEYEEELQKQGRINE